MTVKAEIVRSELPSSVARNEKIPWSIGIRTTGTGEDYIGGGMFERPVESGDHPVNGAVFILADREGNPVKVPPGRTVSGTIPIDPLADWMTTIPDRLEWVTVVGWLERTNERKFTLHGTDRKDHTVPVTKAPGGVWQWVKEHPKVVGATAVGAVGLTYVAVER